MLIKKGLASSKPFIINLLASFFALLIQIPYALLYQVDLHYFPLIFTFAVLANFPTFAFPYIICKTDISLAGTVLAIYPIYTVLLSTIFLREQVNIVQIFGILLIVAGLLMVLKVNIKKMKVSRWLFWALLVSVAMGVGAFINKLSIVRFGLPSYVLVAALSNIPCLLITRVFDHDPIKLNINRKILFVVLSGNILMPLGVLFLYIALSNGPASLVSPIVSIYPAITVILAYCYLKERIERTKIYGIAAIILGVLLLAVRF